VHFARATDVGVLGPNALFDTRRGTNGSRGAMLAASCRNVQNSKISSRISGGSSGVLLTRLLDNKPSRGEKTLQET